MTGKAKNMPQRCESSWGGGRVEEWGTWPHPRRELSSLRRHSLTLRPILRKSAIVIFRQQLKTFDPNNFTLSLMFYMPQRCESSWGGGRVEEWGTWPHPRRELSSLRRHSLTLRPILRKSAIVIFRQQLKTFDPNNFTLFLMLFSQNGP